MGIGMAHLVLLILLTCVLTGVSPTLSSSTLSSNQSEDLAQWDTLANSPLASDVIRFANGTELQLFPTTLEDTIFLKHAIVNGTRRMLGDFHQCSPCTCCDRTRRWCLPTVCCYNIRCGLRGLPFGLCSFIPISCTCFGCQS